ncbi:MAG: STAS domain-containing protein [Planctomycetota bacterium]|jgi:anti-anti-sigma factor
MFEYRIMEGPDAARAAVIELWGSLDGAAAPGFRGTVDACLECGIRDLVLDFGRVHFVGSSGFAEVLSCLERLGQDGNLLLSRVPGRVLVVAEMLGLAPVLDIVADEHEAREVLWGKPA